MSLKGSNIRCNQLISWSVVQVVSMHDIQVHADATTEEKEETSISTSAMSNETAVTP